jgi:hypothetical protein
VANLQWLDQLRHELWKCRVPRFYSERLISELSEHLVDLQKENPSMDAHLIAEERLGNPEHLAAAAQREFRYRTFAVRHPVWAFAIGPVPALIPVFVSIFLLTWWIEISIGMTTPIRRLEIDPPTTFQWCVSYASVYVQRFLPFGLTAWWFSRKACRVGRPLWGLFACGVISCFAFHYWCSVHPGPGPYSGLILFSYASVFGFRQYVQAAFPLVVGLWVWRRSKASLNALHSEERAVSPSGPVAAPSHA